ncbi:phage tail protein [Sediminibacillus massiliensis]|uniref:phage tail protein n=1 Tax=Sediminibacillus massiliensis TaxID=1926277 RepID=UPI0009887638|nr:hypothetical protein [Sediminibacillus massiliensis]
MANYSVDAELKAHVGKFKKAIQSARRVTEKFKRESESVKDTTLNADTQPLRRNIKKARQQMQQFRREHGKTKVDIGATVAEFFRKASLVSQKARDLTRDKVIVEIDARVDKFQSKMDRIAKTIQTFGTIGQNMLGGGLLAVSPALAPILASGAGALGGLGPMIGTLAGGIAGLGTAFGLAGAGAAAFGAVAVSNLGDVFGVSSDLKKLQDKLAVTTDEEKRNEILEEMAVIQGTLNKEQTKALESLRGMQKVWGGIMGKLEKPTIQIFTKAMEALSTILKMAEPTFQGATDAVNNLMDSFNQTLQTEDVKAFFKWMGDYAGPALETLSQAGMNFMIGFMNMARAFGPLSVDMQNGFLGMSESFREWTSGLGESKKFQAFIDYVRENGPKLINIFSNIVSGLVGMFSAFAPLSADMMTGLENLTSKFKTWGQTLSENQQFQAFVDYVRENGPKVIELIGNLTGFLVNLGQGMAPLGSKILDIVNGFLSWSNSMMDAHPWIGKVVAVVLSLAGVLTAMIPLIIGWKVAFGGAFTLIGKGISGVWKIFAPFRMNMIAGFKMLGSSVLTFVSNFRLWSTMLIAQIRTTLTRWITSFASMIASAARWAAGVVISFVKVAGRFAWMAIQATVNALKIAATFTGQMLVAALKWSARMITMFAQVAARYAWMAARALVSAARVAASFVIAMGPVGWVIATVVALVALIIANWDKVSAWTKKAWSVTWNFIKDIWSKISAWTLESAIKVYTWVKQKFDQAKTAIQTAMKLAWSILKSIWSNIKSFFTSTLSNIYNNLRQKFSDMVSAVREKMSDAWGKIQDIWGNVMDFFRGIDLYGIGQDIIQGLINGIKNMAGAVVDAATGVVGNAIEGAKNLLGINSPSRVFRGFGVNTLEGFIIGVKRMKNKVANASKMVAATARDSFNPNLQVKSSQITSSLKNLKRNSSAKVQSAVNADVSVRKQPIQIIIRNEADAEWLRTYVNEGNAIDDRVSIMD